jgi:hypothetical protein
MYLGGFYELFVSGATDEEISNHLWHIVKDNSARCGRSYPFSTIASASISTSISGEINALT